VQLIAPFLGQNLTAWKSMGKHTETTEQTDGAKTAGERSPRE